MDSEFHIGRIAKRLGVSSTYLRRLERQQRIPPARRDVFGGRVYSEFDFMLLRKLGISARPKKLKKAEDVWRRSDE